MALISLFAICRTDPSVPHNLRIKKHAFSIDLRAAAASGDPESWNHAVYKYTASFREDPNAIGNRIERTRQIEITTSFVANGDLSPPSSSNPSDDAGTRREQETVYVLAFSAATGKVSSDGAIVIGGTTHNHQDWQSMKLTFCAGVSGTPFGVWAPASLFRTYPARDHWQAGEVGNNDQVTYERLNTLGLQKNTW